MINKLFILLVLLFSQLMAASDITTVLQTLQNEQGYIALCYHDVVETFDETINDSTTPVLLSQLVDDFEWLKRNGYNVISVQDILAANKGEKRLPPKSVLITFDDGYESFYAYVFPLIKIYRYPVLLALETQWLDTLYTDLVDYGDDNITRSIFLTWEQINEMGQSELVSFAGHSDNLHRGILANPQGNMQPAAITLIYDNATASYETPDAYKKRIEDDLRINFEKIKTKGGKAPVAMVWPYGQCTQAGVDTALNVGFEITFALSYSNEFRDLWNGVDDIRIARRNLMEPEQPLAEIFQEMPRMLEVPQRVVHVDLDYIYSPDPVEQEKNLSILLDRLMVLRPNSVYLQAYVDSDGNGTADALYFPNRHLPMKADLFNRTAWQISTRIQANVYAWMPVSGFDLGDDSMIVKAVEGHKGSVYRRLSIFNPEARAIIMEIYEDLAMHAHFSGILYHDDAVLGEYEDISEAGLAWMRSQGLPTDINEINQDRELKEKFMKAKTKAIIDFTNELTEVAALWNVMLRTARNIYAEPVLNPRSEAWFAQNYKDFLNNYDYTAIMAMPYMENAKNPPKWLKNIAKIALREPEAAYKTVFELQTVNWHNNREIPSEELAKQMLLLSQAGVRNIGYYPDDFVTAHPDVYVIKPEFSQYPEQFRRR